MPYQKINGIEIYYEQHGQGRPLLLLNGLAFPMDLWFAQIRDLSADFCVIAPDNRGIGRSGKPDEEYSIALMASDAAGLLKALGIEKAHIAGLSMGGFIAQEIALSCPGIVDRLILIATSMGGPRARELGRPFWEKVVPAIAGKPAAEVYRTDLSMMSAPGFAEKHKDILKQAVDLRMRNPQPLRAFMRQYAACEVFDTNSRVQAITQPVMVIAGKDDPVVPFPLAEDFLKKLPGAKMISYENCGHAILLEKASELTRDIREFLLDETETASG